MVDPYRRHKQDYIEKHDASASVVGMAIRL